MVQIVADCPRCGAAHVTCDVAALNATFIKHGWQHWFEAFAVCRHCNHSSIFVISEKTGHDTQMFERSSPMKLTETLNNYFSIEGFISLKDRAVDAAPEHVPDDIRDVFREGAVSVVTQCWNAAGAMFRTCIDLATRPMLPSEKTEGLNAKTRRDLGLRLPWLFKTGRLPESLRELSTCIREDGNDGAHAATLKKEDAADLLDFTTALLTRLYTEPKRLELAKERRDKRRASEK